MGTVQKTGRAGPHLSRCRVHPQGFLFETYLCCGTRRRLGPLPDRFATRSRTAIAPAPLVPERFVGAGPFRTTAGATFPAKYLANLPWLCADDEIAGRRDRKSTRLNSSHLG